MAIDSIQASRDGEIPKAKTSTCFSTGCMDSTEKCGLNPFVEDVPFSSSPFSYVMHVSIQLAQKRAAKYSVTDEAAVRNISFS